MACTGKRGYICAVVLFGVLAVAFHGFAFVAPGWIMLGRDMTKAECKQFETIGITEEEAAIRLPPQATGGPVPMAKRAVNDMIDTTTQVPDEIHGEVEEFRAWIVRAVVGIEGVCKQYIYTSAAECFKLTSSYITLTLLYSNVFINLDTRYCVVSRYPE